MEREESTQEREANSEFMSNVSVASSEEGSSFQIDKTDAELDDWVKIKNEDGGYRYEWSDDVTSQASAENIYGPDSEWMGKNHTYQSITGRDVTLTTDVYGDGAWFYTEGEDSPALVQKQHPLGKPYSDYTLDGLSPKLLVPGLVLAKHVATIINKGSTAMAMLSKPIDTKLRLRFLGNNPNPYIIIRPKSNPSAFGLSANQWKAIHNRMTRISKMSGRTVDALGFWSKTSALGQVGISTYQFFNDETSPLEYGSDLIMTRVSLAGPIGALSGAAYFLWIKPAIKNGMTREEINQATQSDLKGNSYICFVEGTMITKSDNKQIKIEDIVVGDIVKTFNESKEIVENKEVTSIYAGYTNELACIRFSDSTLNYNTISHPYYVKDKGWCSIDNTKKVQAKYNLALNQLKKGDIVFKYERGLLTEIKIESIKIVEKKVKVYNLSGVADNHNFFANRILVHNKYHE